MGGILAIVARRTLLLDNIRAFALLSLVALGPSTNAFAGSGAEGAAFLDIPAGAGPAALGAAYSALANDAYAPTWNPGGLGFLESTQFSAQHLAYLDPNHYEYASVVHPLSAGRTLGASAQYWGSGSIPGTDVSGNPTQDFTSAYGAYSIAYGQTLSDRLAIGVTGKWISAKIDDVSASAYALDLGTMYKPSDHLTLAAVVADLGSKLKFVSEGDSLPLALHLGAAYTPSARWRLSGEGVYRKAGLASAHLGAEWKAFESFSLRGGYRTDTLEGLSPLAGLTVGFGVSFWNQELSYAWLPLGDLGSTHYISMLFRLGKKEPRNLAKGLDIKRHRTVEVNPAADVEYLQLMQLLNNEGPHVAEGGRR